MKCMDYQCAVNTLSLVDRATNHFFLAQSKEETIRPRAEEASGEEVKSLRLKRPSPVDDFGNYNDDVRYI